MIVAESEQKPGIIEACDAAARQAYEWSCALASPGRDVIGPNLIPCRSDRTPIRGWREDHPPGHQQQRDRLAQALRMARSPDPEWRASTWAIVPASDGLIVIDVDDMSHLPRVLSVFGRTPVYMRSRSGKVHLYYRGPAVCSRNHLWGRHTIDIKSTSMVHVAGDGAVPGRELPSRGQFGWLRPSLPVFPVDVYESILEGQRAAQPTRAHEGDDPHYATTAAEVNRIRQYMQKSGPAISGSGGHDHTFYLLRNIGDLGASEELALELALEWDATCQPPWGADEIRAKVRDAYATRTRTVGCRADERGLAGDVFEDELSLEELSHELRQYADAYD